MILIDANLLLYAADTESPHHEPSRIWLENTLSSGRAVRFAVVTVLSFVRIASDRRIFSRPLSPAEACSRVDECLALPNVRLLQPGPNAWRLLGRMCQEGQAKGPVVMDAHLAALAMEHGASIATTDRDFMRFPDIEVVNPAAPNA
ncbi:MAG: PIN domain-containing protein [Rhodospirillales bacterium]|nr:PIN domain-containing protein [Rhodospirillales bacterium]